MCSSMERGSVTREIWAFVVLAYGLSWILTIPGILIAKGTESPFVILAAYGPAVAGMLLSYRGERDRQTRLSTRLIWLSLFWVLCWSTLYFGALMEVSRPVPDPAKVFLAIVIA